MTTTRSLNRHVDRSPPNLGSGSPRGHEQAAREQRAALGQYLLVDIGVPADLLEDRLDKMTLAERVFAEVEMQSRLQVMHSYDYDPLRYGR